jgi:uncharacterized protein YmfQ (DUF2313 family)
METRVLQTMLVVGIAATIGLPWAAYSAERSDRPSERGREGSAERPKEGTDGPRYSDRARKSQWEKGKDELVRALKPGQDRDFYRKELDKLGYQITSVNYDKPDYFEYEVVKGDQTYEIQMDLDKSSRKVTKVEVSSNMWQAETTDQILKGRKTNKKDVGGPGNARYSDRDRKSNWEKGRDELTRALKVGEDRDFYRKQLEKLGYQITAVNSDKADYVEYEVVKGDRSYEVQIAIDKNISKATKVDIDTNVWKATGTERALETKQAKSTPAKREREKSKTSDR